MKCDLFQKDSVCSLSFLFIFSIKSHFINAKTPLEEKQQYDFTGAVFTEQCATVTSVKLNLPPDKIFLLIYKSVFPPSKKDKDFLICTSCSDILLLFETLHCLSVHGRMMLNVL